MKRCFVAGDVEAKVGGGSGCETCAGNGRGGGMLGCGAMVAVVVGIGGSDESAMDDVDATGAALAVGMVFADVFSGDSCVTKITINASAATAAKPPPAIAIHFFEDVNIGGGATVSALRDDPSGVSCGGTSCGC